MRAKDAGVIIDFDCGEDISAASSVELLLRHEGGKKVALSGAVSGTQIVRATTTSTSIDRDGVWDVQAHVVQAGLDRRSTSAELVVGEALDD